MAAHRFFFALLLFSSLALAAPSSEIARGELKSKGHRFVVSKYFSCNIENSSGYSLIEAGSLPWIEIGKEIIPYTQGCEREGLYFSLALALPKAPLAILPLVSERNYFAMCLPPSVGDDSSKSWLTYLENLEKVLVKVKNGKLSMQRDACLDKLREMREQFLEPELEPLPELPPDSEEGS